MNNYAPVRTITKIEANPILSSRKDEYRRLRVAAYCRVSTDEEDQLNSLETQMQYYTSKIAENPNWTMVGIYADEGITGTRADKRDKFMKLMRDCQKGKVDYILTKSTSRFARNTVDSLTWIRKLRAIGIGVYFEEQNLDSSKVENETLIGFFSVMAQSESESISGNVKWGIHKRMRNGTYAVQFNMLGYKRGDDGEPYIIPEEAEIVKELFNRFLDGASLGQLKDFLESKKVLTRRGKSAWSISVIRGMLSNEKYVGDILYQKTYRADCISKKVKVNRGEMTRYLVSNNHAPIIDRDTFNLVQAELSRRTSKNKKMDSAITEQGKYSGKFALSELLICGSCGSAYRRNSKVAKGKTTYYWRCVNRVEHGTKYCKDSAGVEEKMLQESICRCLSKMLEDSQEVYSLIQSNLTYAVSGNSAALDMHLIETQMKQVKQDADNMMEKMSKTEGSTELYEKALSELFEQLVALRTQYEQARAQSEQSDSVNAEVQRILNILKTTEISFTEYDDLTVRRLVECIQVCGREKIIVTLKGGYQAEEELRRNDA